jgi:hypothetical protein
MDLKIIWSSVSVFLAKTVTENTRVDFFKVVLALFMLYYC